MNMINYKIAWFLLWKIFSCFAMRVLGPTEDNSFVELNIVTNKTNHGFTFCSRILSEKFSSKLQGIIEIQFQNNESIKIGTIPGYDCDYFNKGKFKCPYSI